MLSRLVTYVRHNKVEAAKRVLLALALVQFLQVVLLVWLPSYLHRDAFPDVPEAGYVSPAQVDCGSWPDDACRSVRREYGAAWTLASRPDFAQQLEAWLAQQAFKGYGATSAAEGLAEEFQDAPDDACLRDAFLGSAYRRAKGQATVSLGQGLFKLLSSLPLLDFADKQQAKAAAHLLDAAGGLVGDDAFLTDLVTLGSECSP